jgi:hypothetical protein
VIDRDRLKELLIAGDAARFWSELETQTRLRRERTTPLELALVGAANMKPLARATSPSLRPYGSCGDHTMTQPEILSRSLADLIGKRLGAAA